MMFAKGQASRRGLQKKNKKEKEPQGKKEKKTHKTETRPFAAESLLLISLALLTFYYSSPPSSNGLRCHDNKDVTFLSFHSKYKRLLFFLKKKWHSPRHHRSLAG